MDVSMRRTLNQSAVRTKVHDMIAADRAIVNDDICDGSFLISTYFKNTKSSPHAHNATAFHCSQVIGVKTVRGRGCLNRLF